MPEAAASYRFSSNYSISIEAARGFRNPTIRELYLFPAPNPNLQPENLWNYQATFQARPARHLLAWTTAYYADLTNVISVVSRFPRLALTNGGRAINRGFDINTRWNATNNLGFQAGYAFLRSTNLLPNVPENKLTYGVSYATQRFNSDLNGFIVGRTFANAARTRQLGGYNVTTFRLGVPTRKRINAFVVVDNLFNKRYQVVEGYPLPGTTALAGLSWRF